MSTFDKIVVVISRKEINGGQKPHEMARKLVQAIIYISWVLFKSRLARAI